MSDKLGPITFGRREEQIFLGREIANIAITRDTAPHYRRRVRAIVEKGRNSIAHGHDLTKHRDKLDAVAKALLEKEVLDGSAIDDITVVPV